MAARKGWPSKMWQRDKLMHGPPILEIPGPWMRLLRVLGVVFSISIRITSILKRAKWKRIGSIIKCRSSILAKWSLFFEPSNQEESRCCWISSFCRRPWSVDSGRRIQTLRFWWWLRLRLSAVESLRSWFPPSRQSAEWEGCRQGALLEGKRKWPPRRLRWSGESWQDGERFERRDRQRCWHTSWRLSTRNNRNEVCRLVKKLGWRGGHRGRITYKFDTHIVDCIAEFFFLFLDTQMMFDFPFTTNTSRQVGNLRTLFGSLVALCRLTTLWVKWPLYRFDNLFENISFC